MRNLLIALIGSVVLIANPVPGGPLIKNHISADTDWFVHVDHERFKKSQLGQFVRAELIERGIEEKLEVFANVVSFHPFDDIKDVTIYGRGSDQEKAVVLMKGRFDKKQLEAAVHKNPEGGQLGPGEHSRQWMWHPIGGPRQNIRHRFHDQTKR